MQWKQVRIPKELLKDIRNTIKENPLWLNEPDFIRDALRDKIEKVRRKFTERPARSYGT